MKSETAAGPSAGRGSNPADTGSTSAAAVPWNEADRLRALDCYAILDTPPEVEFDDVVCLVADLFEAPIAVVNLVAEARQWFKAELGLGVRETPLDVSICAHAILQPGIFVVPDTTKDERFRCNPLVTGEPGLRFYAGALLETPEGLPLGTLCVLDTKVRPEGITSRQRQALEVLARQVMTQLELRRAVQERGIEIGRARASEVALRESEERLRFMQSAGGIGSFDYDMQADRAVCSPEYYAMFGLPDGYAVDRDTWPAAIHPDDRQGALDALDRAIRERQPFDFEYRIVRADNREVRWLAGRAAIVFDAQDRPWRFVGGNVDITERKRVDEALRRSEERYRQIVEGAEEFAIVTLDNHGAVTGWNRGAERIMGWSSEEALGQPSALFFTPEDVAKDVPSHEINRAQAAGRAVDERWHLRKDGSRFFGSGLIMRLDAPGGGFLKIFRDRTAEHEAEAALRESEARLERALDAGELGAWELDLVTQSAWRSLQHDRIFGYEELLPEWTYAMFLEHVVSEDRSDIDAKFQAALAGVGRWDFECRIRRPDGALRWIWGQGRVETDAFGEPVRIKGMVRDISDRKGVEEALRLRGEEFSALADNIPTLCWVARADGHIFWYNRRWYEYTGTAPADMEGWGWQSVHDPACLADVVEGWTRSLATGEMFEMTFPLRGADGSFRQFLTRVVPIRDEAGAIVRWFGTNADISEQVEAERLLEQRVAERTAELVQAQEALRQSQKLEAMGQLTGGVAHDFNNLLTPIVGSLDLLHRRGLGGERERRLIDGALQSAERARTLVQRLLAFARRQPLQASAVDISALVRGMAELVASTSGPQIRIVTDVADDLPAAVADPNQLEMAILNLAVNARDAMPDGGTLTVAAARETVGPGHRSKLKPADYVRLSVSDTGAGMDEATIQRAVEPFFSTKGIGKGTGLGLSMVHGLASQLGGALDISSKPGLGTTVALWLPISGTPAEAPERPAELVPEASAIGTALLVDDEELVRTSIADMLADLGYEVVEAASGEEALKILERGTRIDLLVTDHLMPGMTGTDLARTFKERRPGKPVLLVSGYAEAEGMAPDLARLTKPFRQADLAASLASLSPL